MAGIFRCAGCGYMMSRPEDEESITLECPGCGEKTTFVQANPQDAVRRAPSAGTRVHGAPPHTTDAPPVAPLLRDSQEPAEPPPVAQPARPEPPKTVPLDERRRYPVPPPIPVSTKGQPQPSTGPAYPSPPPVKGVRGALQRLNRTDPSSVKPALLVGGAAAIVCALLWSLIAWLTGYEMYWMAIGVGLIVGGAVATSAPADKSMAGAAAGGLSIAGIFVGKMIMLQLFMYWPPVDLEDTADTEDFVKSAVCDLMLRPEGRMSPEYALWRRTDDATRGPLPAHLVRERNEVRKEIEERVATLTSAERTALIRRYMRFVHSRMTFGQRVRLVTHPLDPLWTMLAVIGAWLLAARGAQARG